MIPRVIVCASRPMSGETWARVMPDIEYPSNKIEVATQQILVKGRFGKKQKPCQGYTHRLVMRDGGQWKQCFPPRFEPGLPPKKTPG